jgi:hypothetical protein
MDDEPESKEERQAMERARRETGRGTPHEEVASRVWLVNLFHWTDAAKSDLRNIDREQALYILHHLTDYRATGLGDIKQRKGSTDFRLRIGG